MSKPFQYTAFTSGEVIQLRFTIITGEDPNLFESMLFTIRPGLLQPVVLTKALDAGIEIDSQMRVVVNLMAQDTEKLGNPIATRDFLWDLWRTDFGSAIQMARGLATVR